MALRITDTKITSDEVGETARLADGCLWHVTGWPGREFDRNQAITAMTLAEERARPRRNEALIRDLSAELGNPATVTPGGDTRNTDQSTRR
jgi:hypothetical protein